MIKINKKSMKWLTVVSIVLIAGCKQQEDLETSVNNRWKQLIASEYEQAYEYLSPAYKKIEKLASYSLRTETAKLRVNWIKGQFKSKECQDDVCEVTIELEYKYSFPRRSMGQMELKTELSENWIRINDKWYFIPSEQNDFK